MSARLPAGLARKYFSDIAEWRIPSGGFYIWLRLTVPVQSNGLFKRALKRGVLLNPGILYDRSAAQFLRLSYAYASPEQMKQALCVVRQLVFDEARRK
jgi:GntR family transcriptional regulator of abcA and norABC